MMDQCFNKLGMRASNQVEIRNSILSIMNRIVCNSANKPKHLEGFWKSTFYYTNTNILVDNTYIGKLCKGCCRKSGPINFLKLICFV